MDSVDRSAIALAFVGLALGFGAWLYVLINPQPNVWIGFALAVGCVASLSCAFLMVPVHRHIKIPLVCVFSLAFLAVFMWRGIPAILSQIEKAVTVHPVETPPPIATPPPPAPKLPAPDDPRIQFTVSALWSTPRKRFVRDQVRLFDKYLTRYGIIKPPEIVPPFSITTEGQVSSAFVSPANPPFDQRHIPISTQWMTAQPIRACSH